MFEEFLSSRHEPMQLYIEHWLILDCFSLLRSVNNIAEFRLASCPPFSSWTLFKSSCPFDQLPFYTLIAVATKRNPQLLSDVILMVWLIRPIGVRRSSSPKELEIAEELP